MSYRVIELLAIRLLAAVVVAIATVAASSNQDASLSGTIRMSTGTVPGVTVKVLTADGVRATSTNARGEYRIDRLPLGSYVVTAELAGFQTMKTEVTFRAGQAETWSPVIKERMPRAKEPVETYVRALAGPNPEACGQHRTPVSRLQLKASLDCGIAAAKAKRPFIATLSGAGFDNAFVWGLLGAPDGKMFLFDYDSAPCGGPSCEARFIVERCEAPDITGPGSDTVKFTCRART